MISVLIPVFNRDVVELVKELSRQLQFLQNTVAEITVMDDCSDAFYQEINQTIVHLPFVRYLQLPANTGRIQARVLLAEAARHEWLIFLDCDSSLLSAQFISSYCKNLDDLNKVTVGGRLYARQKPADKRFILHWKYGCQREAYSTIKPGHVNRFLSNNFLISKSVFKKLDFSKGWNSYGYEDSWMAMQFEEMQVPVRFIHNPVLHEGLETSSVFINKTKQALLNLYRLSLVMAPGSVSRHVKLYHYFYLLKSWRLLWLVRIIYAVAEKFIIRNLYSSSPSLYLFDLFRLHFFISNQQVWGKAGSEDIEKIR